jgi:recombinational DNA repair protein (RecF pathway)
MARCTKCNKELVIDEFKTVYGESLCENCWDDYLMTDKGKVEYFVGICRSDYPTSDFDADFLGHVAECWKKYRNLVKISQLEIRVLETQAKAFGIL